LVASCHPAASVIVTTVGMISAVGGPGTSVASDVTAAIAEI
jgi:hypothetical protein